jgi:peptidoglycan/LPS O-acetylase OafA/YrhL
VTAKRLAGLEVVRAACALVVLWSHVYGETLGLPQDVVGVAISSFSLEAVSGFFVLSGCVISLQNYAGIGPYVRSRLVRILPIYYVLLAASTLAMVGCGVAFGSGRLIANATFLQSPFWDPIFPMRFYVPSWTLAYEIYYYLAFVALLLVPRLLAPLLVASVAVGARRCTPSRTRTAR